MSNKRVCVVYDTVDDMFNDIDITETMLVMTLGRENVGDGKGGYYEITTKVKKGSKQWVGETFPKDSPYFAKLLDNPGDYKLSRNLLELNERIIQVSNKTTILDTDLETAFNQINTKCDGKANTSHNHSAADITSGTLSTARGGITAEERTDWNSKAAGNHKHSAADITSGTLSVARGGTGTTSYTDLVSKLGLAGSKITRTDGDVNDQEGFQVYNFKLDCGLQIYCQRYRMDVGSNGIGVFNKQITFAKEFLRPPICVVNVHTSSPDKIQGAITDTSTTGASFAVNSTMNSSDRRTVSIIAIGIAK